MVGFAVIALLSVVGQNLASPENVLMSRSSLDQLHREVLSTATDPNGRMTVLTKVNGQGPFPFTVDTGANRSVISDKLANQLGISKSGSITIEGLVGPDTVDAVHLDQVSVGSTHQYEVDTAVLPATSLGATGFLGTDMLQDRNVVFDFKRRLITLTRARGRVETEGTTITVTARRRLGQLVVTDAEVGGKKVVAIIDTGAENTVGNYALRKALLGDKPVGATGELIGVTGKSIPGEAGLVPKIRIGDLRLGNMPVVFADPHTFRLFKLENTPAVLIGMDVLRLFNRVAIDFTDKEVRFNIGEGWNPPTRQALNRPRNEDVNDGGAGLLARTDQAGAGLDSGRDLLRD